MKNNFFLSKKPYISGHQVKLLHSGENYFDALVKLIDSAKNVLHLQVYIFEEDTTGRKIARALLAAAKRGVNVFLMVDGFGAKDLSKEFIANLKSGNVYFRYFSPLPFPGITQAGRRLHQKVCVADAQKAIVGGINIADKYRGDEKQKAWFDYAVEIEGPACAELNLICQKIWKRRFRKYTNANVKLEVESNTGVQLRVSQNDWFRRLNQISSAYKQMLDAAQKEILIVASYFIPTRRLLSILLYSASRKRDVKIVLSRNSDVPFIKGAMNYLYEKLLQEGVKIFEYNESVLHAKVCVVDREWSSIGSHNLNHLSEFISVELNIEILNLDFSEKFAHELISVMADQCIEVTLENFRKELNTWTRFKNWLSFRIVSASQRLLFVLNSKEGNSKERRRFRKMPS
ncbi:cardiolipin synthase ClsB [soil metagenome]